MRTALKGFLVLAAVALPLAGCGVKSSPEHPAESGYPRIYPAPGSPPGPQTGSAPPRTEPGEKPKEGKAYSPLGFPLEYPNRPYY